LEEGESGGPNLGKIDTLWNLSATRQFSKLFCGALKTLRAIPLTLGLIKTVNQINIIFAQSNKKSGYNDK